MMKFWLVWNERRGLPSHKHLTALEAKLEAERLARNNPGQNFHVLEWKGTATKVDIQWVDEQSDIPF